MWTPRCDLNQDWLNLIGDFVFGQDAVVTCLRCIALSDS